MWNQIFRPGLNPKFVMDILDEIRRSGSRSPKDGGVMVLDYFHLLVITDASDVSASVSFVM